MIDFSKNPLFLAPMADISDKAFRYICKTFGADVSVSEMISSNALVFENDKTLKMLEKNELETPYIVQLSGSDASVMKKAVMILNDFEGIDGIDLNAGCPVNKVIKQCAGSALLDNLELLKELLYTIKTYSNKKTTSVKIRLGFVNKTVLDTVKAIDDLVDFIAIHGRTRAQMYKPDIVDYELIAKAKSISKVPIVANGDINDTNYQDIKLKTNADGLMIGRGAIGKPWIFKQIKTGEILSNDDKLEAILLHFDKMCELCDEFACVRFRKHLHEYSRGLDGASEFRNAVNRIDNNMQMRDSIGSFFAKAWFC